MRPAPDIRWAVTSTGILLLDRRDGRTIELSYPEAAIWDILARDGTIECTAAKLAPIAELDAAASLELVSRRIEEWLAAGLIAETSAHG